MSKYFTDGCGEKHAYAGVVAGYDAHEELYKVEYEDEDEEELDEWELGQIVVPEMKKRGVRWRCDVCKAATFPTYRECEDHETVCAGTADWGVAVVPEEVVPAIDPPLTRKRKKDAERADPIDERDADDPACVTAYVEEMYQHYRSREAITSVRPTYMEEQPYINERMRGILIDCGYPERTRSRYVPTYVQGVVPHENVAPSSFRADHCAQAVQAGARDPLPHRQHR